MLQAVTQKAGSIIMRESDLPKPLPDHLLVEVKAAGICGSDLAIHRGPFPGRLTLPRVLGHEWSGQVIEIGSAVENFSIGDRVVSEEIFWCGNCSRCRIGAFDLCEDPPELGFTVDGAHATHVTVPERYCYRLPESLDYTIGALVEPLAVAYNGLNHAADGVQPGQRVLIIGLGPIGISACLWAKAGGAIVHAVDTSEFRVELARNMGFEQVETVPADALLEQFPQQMRSQMDLLVEAAGDHAILARLLPVLCPRGKAVVLGHCGREVPISLETVVLQGLTIAGSCGQIGHSAYARVLRALEHGVIDPSGLITHKEPLDRIVDMFEFANTSNRFGKIQIIPGYQ